MFSQAIVNLSVAAIGKYCTGSALPFSTLTLQMHEK